MQCVIVVYTRNTPTGVGKTSGKGKSFAKWWKHPHGRGEDVFDALETEFKLETPPRAWGRRLVGRGLPAILRNTPTGVGKTDCRKIKSYLTGKHPHGSGEDSATIEEIRAT